MHRGSGQCDRILYNRLCEKDRADVLEERFIKENEEMK